MLRTIVVLNFIFSGLLLALHSTGQVRIAAILVKFQDDVDNVAYLGSNFPLTPARCRAILFDSSYSVAGFLHENSYGKLTISGDVFGPYVIPVNAPTEEDDGTCMSYVETILVADQDIRFDNYDLLIFIYPRTKDKNGNFVNHCGFQGAQSEIKIDTNEGHFAKDAVWVNGFLDLHVVVHEMGHRFGLAHAGKRLCRNCYDYENKCTANATNDPFDVMGYNTAPGYQGPGHFSAYNKYSLNWLEEKNIFRIAEFGIYDVTLSPLEENTAGVKMVAVPTGNQQTYYIEFRQNNGYDSHLAPLNGLLFRIASSNNRFSITELVGPNCDSENMVLRTGQDFYDINSPLHIHVVTQSEDNITLRINYLPIELRVEFDADSWPDSLVVGDSLRLSFTVHNDSGQPLVDSLFLYYNIVTPASDSLADSTFLAAGMAVDEEISSAFTFGMFHGCGNYNFKLAVFTSGILQDKYPANNFLTDPIFGKNLTAVCAGADLQVTLRTSTDVVLDGQPIDIFYDMQNIGDKNSGPFSIHFQSPEKEAEEKVAGLAPGESLSRVVRESFACGVYDLAVSIDPENVIPETNEQNNIAKKVIWSEYACDGKIKPLYAGHSVLDFQLNDNTLFIRAQNIQDHFYFYSLKSHSTQIIAPHNNRSFGNSFDVSNKFFAAFERATGNLNFLCVHNLVNGDVQQIQLDYSDEIKFAVNDEWITWIDRDAKIRLNRLFIESLATGEKYLIAETAQWQPRYRSAELTETNLLYWLNRIDGEDYVMVCDLACKTGQVRTNFKRLDELTFWKNLLIQTSHINGNPMIEWHEYDPDEQTFTQRTTTFLHDSWNPLITIIDYNGSSLIYYIDENRDGHFRYYLYLQDQNESRNISSVFDNFQPTYLTEEEIVGLFQHNNDSLIGSVRIDEVWAAATSVKAAPDLPAPSSDFIAAPNPFNSNTTISYILEKPATVEMHIFNPLGQLVRTFTAVPQTAGTFNFRWDGTNNTGDFVANGVYFCVLDISDKSAASTKRLKLVLLK